MGWKGNKFTEAQKRPQFTPEVFCCPGAHRCGNWNNGRDPSTPHCRLVVPRLLAEFASGRRGKARGLAATLVG